MRRLIEYHGLAAVLDTTGATLDAAMGDPDLAEVSGSLRAATDAHPDAALLGAFVGPLLAHASADEELGLLRRARDLWDRGLAAAGELHTARIELELALTRDDVPDPVNVLQMGFDRLAALHPTVKAVLQEAQGLKADIDKLEHIRPHPRQRDETSVSWGWYDAFAGRRGHAFVDSLLTTATSERQKAVAAGALAGYAGHVAGSAFLGAVVGGPRRQHRFRDRLARNSLGAWLHHTIGTPDAGALAERLRFERGEEPTIPADLASLLETALGEAYPSRALPDLALGFGRMVEHLELLDSFRVPPPPEPPPLVPVAEGSGGTSEFQTFDQPEDPNGPTIVLSPETDHSAPGVSSQKKAQGDVCLYVLLLIATLGLAYLLWCIGRLTTDKKCGIEDFLGAASPEEPDPRAPQANTQTLQTLREPENANHVLGDVYQLELRLWQAFAAARSFMIVCGLLYPDPSELAAPLHQQFLKSPYQGPWPLATPTDEDESYALPPATPAEQPTAPTPFPDRGPDWLLHVDLVDNDSTFSEVVLATLRSHVAGDPVNLDLDADRGRLHPAWSVAPGASVRDQPLSVQVLPYGAE